VPNLPDESVDLLRNPVGSPPERQNVPTGYLDEARSRDERSAVARLIEVVGTARMHRERGDLNGWKHGAHI
jgi:hypothetical protein